MKCPDCSNRLIPHGRGKNTTLLCNQCGKKHALGSLNKSVFWKTEIDRLKTPTPDAKAGRHVCTECNGEGKTPKCPSCKYSKTIHGKQQVTKPSQRNNKNYTILRSDQAFAVAWELMKSESHGCDVCGETDGLFTYMDNNQKAHMVCSDACMDKNKGEGRGTTPVLGGGRMAKSDEKGDNAPTNPGLWSQAKSKARSKFKVYPSAYANAWASKWYKSKGGGWKKKGKKK
jgi:DNA-directed RNA polymerase subunit M/transcription elongation factor TFIIS